MPKTDTGRRAPSRRHLLKALAAGVAAPAVLRTSPAFAAYPERPVKIVVANSPGGPSDIIARFMAAALHEQTRGAIIVETKGGGRGNIGIERGPCHPPAGHTQDVASL